MVLASKYGQMDLNTRVNGLTTWQMDRASDSMLMGTSMMVTGWTIRQMVMVFICIWKGDTTKGHGKMIFKMAEVLKYGLMVRSTREVKEGMKHGKGKCVWNDGSSYNGEWYENKINGRGIYQWPDGRKYEGEWKENNMHGKGIYQWKDGKKYEGEYINDTKHGYGIYTWADGRQYSG